MANSTATLVMDDTYSITPVAIALRTLAFIALILDLPPLIWHIRSRNLAASTLVAYIILDNLMNLINTLIWPTDDMSNWWPGHGLCDVEIKLMTGTWIGVVSCLVCILRDLARVLDTERTVLSLSVSQRRRQLIVDCMLCFGAPLYMMVAHYVVQSNRYYIFGIAGCNGGFDPSWPSIVLIFIWPPTMCLINIYYAVLIIIRIHRYQSTFSAILASSSTSSLTKNRFLRLFWMAFIMIIAIFPLNCYILYSNSRGPLIPYSWSRVHGPEAWDIMMVPAFGKVSFDRWIQTGAGFLVFFFFGMGRDAMKEYKQALLKIGLGYIFPSLRRERHGGSGGCLGSQGSQTSGTGLLERKKKRFSDRFSRKFEVSLPTYSPKSLSSSSSRSPTQTINEPGHLTGVTELKGGMSDSTAPSTPSSNEKHLATDNQSKMTWLRRCLAIMGITSQGHPQS